jgi:predicted dehydrogenase
MAPFTGGRTAEWCVSWHAGPRHVAEVMGSEGSLRSENAWGDIPNTATTLELFDRHRTLETFEATDRFWLQHQHMQDCFDNGVPHRVPPEKSITQMRIIDAV